MYTAQGLSDNCRACTSQLILCWSSNSRESWYVVIKEQCRHGCRCVCMSVCVRTWSKDTQCALSSKAFVWSLSLSSALHSSLCVTVTIFLYLHNETQGLTTHTECRHFARGLKSCLHNLIFSFLLWVILASGPPTRTATRRSVPTFLWLTV